jgi:hypothetical protein
MGDVKHLFTPLGERPQMAETNETGWAGALKALPRSSAAPQLLAPALPPLGGACLGVLQAPGTNHCLAADARGSAASSAARSLS